MAFQAEIFPLNLSIKTKGGPRWSTSIIRTASGAEQRNKNWASPQWFFDAATAVEDTTDANQLKAFFLSVGGMVDGFLFKDWLDYSGSDEYIGTGDYSEDEFQLIKTYAFGSMSYVRNIYKPKSGTVAIYFDDVEQESGWSVSTSTGIVTFSSPPGEGVVITADFEFYVPVRFESDDLFYAQAGPDIIDATSIPMIELKSGYT